MAGINKAIVAGRVGRDPEIRTTQNNERIASLSIATSETWKDKSGERQERTEWHRVSVFNDGLVDIIERFVTKGSLVGIEGSIQTRKWTDQSGQERYSTEIIVSRFKGEVHLLGSKGDGAGSGGGSRDDYGEPARQLQTRGGGRGVSSPKPLDLDDEIPF